MYVAKKKKQLSSCKLFNEKILIGRLFLRLVFFCEFAPFRHWNKILVRFLLILIFMVKN